MVADDPMLLRVRAMRRTAGLTQARLARLAGVSLATLQKIEAGAANPTLGTLRRVLAVLGLELGVRSRAVDWDALARLGLPLRPTGVADGDADPARLPVLVRQAALALSTEKGSARYRRHEDAFRALLFALRSHFPTTYHRMFDGCAEVEDWTPTRPTGRVIKLARIAKQRLAEVV